MLINVKIIENYTEDDAAKLLDLCLIKGMYDSSFDPPNIEFGDFSNVDEHFKNLSKTLSLKQSVKTADFTDFSHNPFSAPTECLKKPLRQDVSDFFEGLSFIKKERSDFFDLINYKIELGDNSLDTLKLAAFVSYITGLRMTALNLGILKKTDEAQNTILVKKSSKNCISSLKQGEFYRVDLEYKGGAEDLIACLKTYPKTDYFHDIGDLINRISSDLEMKTLEGEVLNVEYQGYTSLKGAKAYLNPSYIYGNKLKNYLSNLDLHSYRQGTLEYEQSFCFENSSVKAQREIEKFIDDNSGLANLRIVAGIEGGKSDRRNFKESIERIIETKRISYSAVDVISQYKQGFSYIENVVIPKIKNFEVDKVNIYFKAFLRDDACFSDDEDGAVPSYNLDISDEKKYLELPIRHLQELYPIDELIALNMDIEKDRIEFMMLPADSDCTYKISCESSAGEVIFEDTYSSSYYERPYLSEFKDLGIVHPECAFVKIYAGGELLFYKAFYSELNDVWNTYEEKVLSEVKNIVEKSKIDDRFFSRLEIIVSSRQEDRDLGIRQEMISPLNSLHEDLYFVSQDYFKHLGLKTGGKPYDAPGLILPIMNKVDNEKTTLQVKIYSSTFDIAKIELDGKEHVLKSPKSCALDLQGIEFKNGRARYLLRSNYSKDYILTYKKLIEKRIICFDRLCSTPFLLSFKLEDEVEVDIDRLVEDEHRQDLSISDIELDDESILYYEDTQKLVEDLMRVSGVEVYEVSKSYMGRSIYAIDIVSEKDKYLPREKINNLRPSLLINSRHHANEVSSTNAAFYIVRELLTNKAYEGVSEKVNISIIPLENPDGAEIHKALNDVNSGWKYHVARFNQLSKEFFGEIFNDDTIHSSALAFTRLFRSKLPDVIIDNHGVPSHEWEQPYSGYASQSFKGFWLPRAMLYAYFWSVRDSAFKLNHSFETKIRDAVADMLNSQAELKEISEDMRAAFEKYACSFMPKLFPQPLYKGTIFYDVIRDFSLDQKYTSHMLPYINTLYFTSEVPDETASGDFLKKLVMTHKLCSLEIINAIISAKVTRDCRGEGDTFKNMRLRPIL